MAWFLPQVMFPQALELDNSETAIPSTAKIVFIGDANSYRVTINSNTIAQAAADAHTNPNDPLYIFGGPRDNQGIPLCIYNNNQLNGLQIQVSGNHSGQPDGDLVMYTTHQGITHSIPISIIMYSNGRCTNSHIPKQGLLTESGPIIPSINEVQTSTNGSGTLQLCHYDTLTLAHTYQPDSVYAGCASQPIYMSIAVKKKDLVQKPAGIYTISLNFDSIPCENNTTDTSKIC